MKINTYTEYTCEICGRTYDSKEDCVKCEAAHITNFKISNYRFPRPIGYGEDIKFEDINRFPEKLVLLFKIPNGEEIEKEYILNNNDCYF